MIHIKYETLEEMWAAPDRLENALVENERPLFNPLRNVDRGLRGYERQALADDSHSPRGAAAVAMARNWKL